MTIEKLLPIHPGEVLLEEFLKPKGISQNRLAIEVGVDARRINEIVLGDSVNPIALDKSPLSHIIQLNYIKKDCEEDE